MAVLQDATKFNQVGGTVASTTNRRKANVKEGECSAMCWRKVETVILRIAIQKNGWDVKMGEVTVKWCKAMDEDSKIPDG